MTIFEWELLRVYFFARGNCASKQMFAHVILWIFAKVKKRLAAQFLIKRLYYFQNDLGKVS